MITFDDPLTFDNAVVTWDGWYSDANGGGTVGRYRYFTAEKYNLRKEYVEEIERKLREAEEKRTKKEMEFFNKRTDQINADRKKVEELTDIINKLKKQLYG